MRHLIVDPDLPLCSSGKRPFRTENAARAQLRRARWVRRENPTGRTERRCYHCPACGYWHLTHNQGTGTH